MRPSKAAYCRALRPFAPDTPDGTIVAVTPIMLRILSTTLVALTALSGEGQTYVYTERTMVFSSIAYTVNRGHITEGQSLMWSDALFTVQNGSIYEGFSTSVFDLLFTTDQRAVYEGDSRFSFDIVYTLENGTVYAGNSTFPTDALYTCHNGVIYRGRSTFPGDAVFWLQGPPLGMAEIVALLLAAGMI